MRIIAGRAGGQLIQAPPGRRTRPTLDRVREAMFSSLAARLGSFDGVRVLDAFAGSGALGLEGWSRGASHVCFVESHGRTVGVLKRNIASLGLADDQHQVLRGKMPEALKHLSVSAPFDLVLLDPPYESTLDVEVLEALGQSRRLAVDALVLVEHDARRSLLPEIEARGLKGWAVLVERRYGNTAFTILRLDQDEDMSQQRLDRIEPSATIAVTMKAKELKAKGVDVIGFGAGEPDFDTPPPIREAAKRALDHGMTRYTPAPGLPAVREAIAETYQERYGIPTEPEQVILTVGGKHALFNVAMAVLKPGDKVLIPAPYWVSYPAQVLIADGEPVFLETHIDNGFRITPEALDEALSTHQPRYMILNSPSNPTGMAYNRDELKGLLDVLEQHEDTMLVWDSIYERLTYDGFQHVEPGQIAPDLRDRTVVVSGFSKAWAMTGWRLGYSIASKSLTKRMAKLQGHCTTNPTAFAQFGAIAALNLDNKAVDIMLTEFDKRRKRMVELLNEMDGVRCLTPKGAFYAFPDLNAFIGAKHGSTTIENDLDLVTCLLEESGIAIVPGSAFGAPGFARLSYATSMDQIEAGLSRMKEGLHALER